VLRTGISFIGVQTEDPASRGIASDVTALELDEPDAPGPVTTNEIPTAFTRPSENCSVSVPGYVPGARLFTIGCTTIWVGSDGEIVASVGSVTS
jgi:hypothetical protein